MMQLRIGKINFLNLYPIFYFLERECDPSHYQFIEGPPSLVNRLIREQEIDISPSSSIEYLRSPDRYTLIEDHSISAKGAIESIILFSTVPLEDLQGKTVLASSQSETSTALLQILLKRFYGLNTKIEITGVDLSNGLKARPAYLLIGDNALRAHISPATDNLPPPLHKYDLGELWRKHTGLPFVFALWIGRRECCDSGEFVHFVTLLDRAKEEALNSLEGVAESYPSHPFMEKKDLLSYWRNISYDLDEENRKGLELFQKYLKEEGII